MRYAGLSSARLASALGVNRSQIVRWRTGDRPVPPHHLPQLREILGGRRTIPGAPPETTWSEQQHLFPLSARASHPVEKMRSASANHSSRPQRQPPRVLATVSLMPIANSATAFLNNWAMRIQPAPTPVSPHRQAERVEPVDILPNFGPCGAIVSRDKRTGIPRLCGAPIRIPGLLWCPQHIGRQDA